MKLRFKEDPKEWRKAAWFGTLGFALLSSLLRWRHVLTTTWWVGILAFLVFVACLAAWRPRFFRGYYRFGMRMGFFVTKYAGFAVLSLFFLVVIVPMGLVMRLFGQDLLALKRSRKESFWVPARPESQLERMF